MSDPDQKPKIKGMVDRDLGAIDEDACLRSAEALFGEEWLGPDDAEAHDGLSYDDPPEPKPSSRA